METISPLSAPLDAQLNQDRLELPRPQGVADRRGASTRATLTWEGEVAG